MHDFRHVKHGNMHVIPILTAKSRSFDIIKEKQKEPGEYAFDP